MIFPRKIISNDKSDWNFHHNIRHFPKHHTRKRHDDENNILYCLFSLDRKCLNLRKIGNSEQVNFFPEYCCQQKAEKRAKA